jgi:hypothetical protein
MNFVIRLWTYDTVQLKFKPRCENTLGELSDVSKLETENEPFQQVPLSAHTFLCPSIQINK